MLLSANWTRRLGFHPEKCVFDSRQQLQTSMPLYANLAKRPRLKRGEFQFESEEGYQSLRKPQSTYSLRGDLHNSQA